MTLAVGLCGTAVLVSWVVAGLGDLGSTGIENTGTASVEGRREADAESVNASQVSVIAKTRVPEVDVAAVTTSAAATAADITTGSDAAESIPEAASAASSPALAADKPPVQVAMASPDDPVQDDTNEKALTTVENLRRVSGGGRLHRPYLWALYQRTPKLDTIKVPERREVTVKKKGKTRTVVKTVTKLVDEDFTWKDPKAAEKLACR